MSVWIWKSDRNHFSEGTDAITAAWGGVRTIFGLVGGTFVPERLRVGFTFSLCYVIAALRSTCVLTHACSSNFPLSSITAAGCTFAWCPRTHTCPPLPAPFFFFFCRFEQAAATKAERSFSCHSFETNRKLLCLCCFTLSKRGDLRWQIIQDYSRCCPPASSLLNISKPQKCIDRLVLFAALWTSMKKRSNW